jgi:apolipoprotein N-acyltransferase
VRALALPRDDWRLIVGGAVLLCAAYPPFHLFLPSFLCLVPAVWLIMAGAEDPRPVRRHLVQGFWFGLLGNGLVLYWITVALWRFSRLSALGYLVTIVVLGVSCAAAFAVTGWVVRRTRVGPVVVFPIVWTTVEWAIGHLPQVGFPWLGLGTSLTGYPTVVQLADIVGARGITYLLALANAALAMAWLRRSDRKRGALLAGGVVVGLVLAWGYGVARERGLAVRPVGRIAVLQPNVGWSEKWEPALQDSIVEGLLNLSARALYESRPGLVVWPEAAVPGYFHRHPQWRRRIAELSRATGTPQLVGGFHYVPGEGGSYEYYNAAFLFDSLGRDAGQPVYHKQYLVPITERVPFLNPRWFKVRFFEGYGFGEPGPVYAVPAGRFGVLICYESAFEDVSRRYRREGADFLVNITNDAWFGGTSAVYQHAAHLVMRAIENRVGIARAANSGISEFVDPLGRRHRRTALDTRTFVAHELVTTDAVTLYTRWGDWVGTLVLVLTAGLVGFGWWRGRRSAALPPDRRTSQSDDRS